MRTARVLGIQLCFVVAGALAPWLLVPLGAIGLFVGGWLSADRADDRPIHRALAWRVGAANGVAIVACWWAIGGVDSELGAAPWPLRVSFAICLGGMGTLAAMGLALVGLDARFGRSSGTPGQISPE